MCHFHLKVYQNAFVARAPSGDTRRAYSAVPEGDPVTRLNAPVTPASCL